MQYLQHCFNKKYLKILRTACSIVYYIKLPVAFFGVRNSVKRKLYKLIGPQPVKEVRDCRVHKSSPPSPVRRHMNPIHAPSHLVFKIKCNIVLILLYLEVSLIV